MKNFYIGKVILFQTDICLVLDQMIEGGKKQKRGPENRGWMGGRFKIWKMPHVLPEECDFPPPQEKEMLNFLYEKPHFVPNNNAKWIASEILKQDGKQLILGYYFFGVSPEVD